MSWQFFALGSAFFAGLTAIFGKIGVAGIHSDLATFIRTVVILIMIAAIVTFRSEWSWQPTLRPMFFLVLSGIATGLSWLFYYRALQLAPASMVAPIDKLSVAFAIVLGVVFHRRGVDSCLATEIIPASRVTRVRRGTRLQHPVCSGGDPSKWHYQAVRLLGALPFDRLPQGKHRSG